MADSREFRSKFIVTSLAFLGILFGILISLYFLGSAMSSVKLDLTADKIFTISKPTKEILADLKDDIIIRYYSSEDVPSSLMNLKRDTIDMFRELEGISNGHFKWEVIAPEDKAREFAEAQMTAYYKAKEAGQTPKEPQQKESFEDLFMGGGRKARKTDPEIAEERKRKAGILAERTKRTVDDLFKQLLKEEYTGTYLADLQKQGIFQVPVEERQGQSTRETNFYTAIEIKYLNKTPEVISVHHQIQGLEYELANKILKLTRKAKPKVVFFDGRKPESPPMNPMNPNMRPPQSDYSAILGELGELFDIEEISLKEKNSISDVLTRMEEDKKKKEKDEEGSSGEEKADHISCLIVAQPNDLEPRQVFEISKAVSEGIPTIFLVSGYSVDISQAGLQNGFPIAVLRPALEDLFRSYGVTLGKEIIASRECSTLVVPQRMPGTQFVMRAPYPMPILTKAVGEAINQKQGLTNRIQTLVFPAAVGFTVSEEDAKKAGLTVVTLANSGKESYPVAVSMFEQDMFNRAQPPSIMKNKDLRDRREKKEGFIDPRPLALFIDGKFPFKFQDQPVPEWKKEDKRGKQPGLDGELPDMPGLPDFGPKGPSGPMDAEALAPALMSAPAEVPVPAPAAVPAPVVPAPAVLAPAADAGQPAAPAVQPAAGAPPAPAEPKKEPERIKIEPKAGRVVLLSSADMMKNEFLMMQGDYMPNANFFYNTIESFGLDERLMQIRRKELVERRFNQAANESSARWIHIINIGLLPLAVGIFGVVQFLVRRNTSSRFERQFIDGKSA